MTNQTSKYNTTLLLVGILFIIWGILGMMDAKNYTYTGYGTDDNWSVINIEEGSPAEASGLQEGDVIKSTGGIAVTDTKARNKRERAKIGETRDIVIDRNGEEQTLQLTFAANPDKNKTNNIVGFIIGLLFIVLGLYANNKHKSALSSAFAVFSVCFGFLFMGGPYISSVLLGSIIGIVSTAILLFSFTALAIYMLRYTPESSFLSSKNYKLIYVPMLLILGIIIVLEVTQMDSSGTLNMVMRLLFGAFIIVYFLIAIITLIRKYMKASSTDRNEKGLNMMLIGTVIGLLPILIYFTINTLSPGADLPGNDYVFYTFAAIPIFFTLALNKLNSADATTE
jgi:membrane-associated protease RseP (regulator of RpoE activity)